MYKDNRSNLNISNVGSFVYGYEISGSIKGREFPDFPVALRPKVGQDLLILVDSRSHKTTHRSRQDSSGHVIGLSQRPLPDNTQHSQQTDTHVPDAIRTCSISGHAAAKLRLSPRSHWDQHFLTY
jgi:hypothetical protein